VRFTENKYMTDLQREKMKTEEYIELTNKRAAIEGIHLFLEGDIKSIECLLEVIFAQNCGLGLKLLPIISKNCLKGYI
jgi:hypothetical protein